MMCYSYSLNFTDDTFTLENIKKMTKDVKDWENLGVLIGIREPKSRFHKIKQVHTHAQSQKEGLLQAWYETHPLASWSLLHQGLQMMGETEAAKLIQNNFLQGMPSLLHNFYTLLILITLFFRS